MKAKMMAMMLRRMSENVLRYFGRSGGTYIK